MNNKLCPVCNNEKWDYDVVSGGFIFCNGCYRKVVERVRNQYQQPLFGVAGNFKVSYSIFLRAIADELDAYFSEPNLKLLKGGKD